MTSIRHHSVHTSGTPVRQSQRLADKKRAANGLHLLVEAIQFLEGCDVWNNSKKKKPCDPKYV